MLWRWKYLRLARDGPLKNDIRLRECKEIGAVIGSVLNDPVPFLIKNH